MSLPPSRTKRAGGARLAWIVVVMGGFINQGMTMVSGIITARMLGVEGRGQIALVAAIAVMAAQLTLGGSLGNAVTNTLATRGATARDGMRARVPAWLALSVVIAVAFAGWFLYLHRDQLTSTTWFLAFAVAVTAIQNIAYRLIVGALLGEGSSPIRCAVAALTPQALITVALVVGFVIDQSWNVVAVSTLMLGCATVALLGSLFLFAPATHEPGKSVASKDLWRLARKTYVSNIGPIDGLALDRTLVGAQLGIAHLGLYTASAAVASLASTLGAGFAGVFLPRVAAAQSERDQERQMVHRWLLVSALSMAVLVGLVEIVVDPVIRLAFGEEFAGAIECARWLLPATALLGYRRVLIAVLQGRNSGGGASIVELALTPVVVGGIWLAARHGSLVMVALTMLLVGVASCVALGAAVAVSGRAPARNERSWEAR